MRTAPAWSFLAGLPVGALGAFVWSDAPALREVLVGAVLGGAALALVAGRIASRSGDSRRAAAASAAGLVALPALLACALRLPPRPAWLLGATLAWLALALLRSARGRGRAGPLRAAALSVGVGAAALGTLSTALAARRGAAPSLDAVLADAVLDRDASIATLALPRCAAAPRRVELLLDRGARPRLGDELWLWFDAAAADGSRQIHRLERASGRIRCWTCGEPGHNLRAAPDERGRAVLFETTRHATPGDPTNTEIHLIETRGETPPASRRVTRSPGPDDHALPAPGWSALVWSRRVAGSYRVVSAPLGSTHGGIALGGVRVLAAAGSRWIAPLAWSPDARSLLVAEGNPFGTLSVRGLDLATGRAAELGDDFPASGGADFNGDGGWLVRTGARDRGGAGRLPARLGFLLAPFAARAERDGPRFAHTRLRVGEPWDEGVALELGPVEAWGEPTGVALSRAEPTLFLGQRRRTAAGVEERILEIQLDCP